MDSQRRAFTLIELLVVIAGKGNCAFADGPVAPASRMDTFPLAWPR